VLDLLKTLGHNHYIDNAFATEPIMTVNITNVAKYTTKGDMAYEITYSEGTKVRAVESKGNTIRKEAMVEGEWQIVGKPYVVDHNKKRAAEQIKQTVLDELAK
jgi:hypothetical protein